MAGLGESRTGPGKGAGGHLRSADGPGGLGGMFAGSEGPERAAGGRHERRQTRQVLSALFLAPVRRMLHRRTGVAATHIGGEPARCEWAATRSFLDTSYRERTRHLKAATWQAPGPSPPLGHSCPNIPCPHGIQTSLSMGWSCADARNLASSGAHQNARRCTPITASKCESLLSTGNSCCRASAAIHASSPNTTAGATKRLAIRRLPSTEAAPSDQADTAFVSRIT